MTKSNEQNILVGIDVGSTTTKIVAVDANDRHQLLFSDYARHHANQIASVIRSIKKFCGHIRDKKIRLCLTGSGGKTSGIYFKSTICAGSCSQCDRITRSV